MEVDELGNWLTTRAQQTNIPNPNQVQEKQLKRAHSPLPICFRCLFLGILQPPFFRVEGIDASRRVTDGG